MQIIDLKEFGPIISDKTSGDEIYALIKNGIQDDRKVEVNLSEIVSMATFCAKQIFGRLYIELGAELFFEQIKLAEANHDVQIIIKMGIQSALED
jgi:hypothetical protein